MNEPLYTIDILRLAASIPHLGRLPDAQGSAEVRSPTCGSKMSADVVLDGHGRVTEFAQQVEACAFGQASAAVLGAQAIGRNTDEVEAGLAGLSAWLDGSRDDPGQWPGIETLAPVRQRKGRHGAVLLPYRALLAAIRDAEGRGS